jgi:hypothetical protein
MKVLTLKRELMKKHSVLRKVKMEMRVLMRKHARELLKGILKE